MRQKLAKPELGEKRICLECSTKYYDLNKDPITCPKCGTIFEIHTADKAKPETEAEPGAVKENEEEEVEVDGPEIISLEDAEDDDGATVDGDDVPDDIPDVPIDDDDDGDTDDDTFLEDDDDDNDNLADIIPVHGDGDDEN